jgi:hypothetical protein
VPLKDESGRMKWEGKRKKAKGKTETTGIREYP